MDDSTTTTESDTTPGSTRDRLVRAMIDVVGSDGLAAASVRTIARRAGCNEAVLYQHFPSKLAMQQSLGAELGMPLGLGDSSSPTNSMSHV